ncbi:MAG: response regulator, partial [Anaerolineae bacterium]|nr:response regulator [Anaerolineae bacterium]
HNEDIISFEFSALSYAAPHKNRYRYRLEGFEDNWNEVESDRRFATYTSLPAGDYVFRVQASNDSGLWSEHEATLHLTILPPWWETVWFRGLVLVGVIGLAYSGYRWRVRQIQQRNRELETQVAARTQALAQAEQQVRSQVDFLQSVLDSLPHPFYVINTADYSVALANEAANTANSVGPITCYALTHQSNHPCSTADHPCPLWQVQQSKKGVTVEHTHFDREGNPRQIELHGYPVFDEAGHVVQMIEYARDITHRRQAEQRIAAMEERERIGRELHDDLGQVMSYVSLQARTARELLKQGQTGQATATLTQLMQVALEAHNDVRQYILGVRTTHPPTLNFFEALEQYLAQLKERYGLETQLSLPHELRDDPLTPDVENQLLRIIQEALTNVRKHAGVARARLFFTVHPDEVQVIIADEGQGFNPDLVTQAVLAEKQTGHFGLEIMRERAEAVGGSLEVRSAEGKGVQVIVRLPRTLQSNPEEAVRGLRLMVVDDHPLYREGLRNMLSVRGIQVVGVAQDGLAAQEMARELQPDLILMDVDMPRCNGVEATRHIKAELPDIKIVMLTVAADDDTIFEALKNGAAGYLLKSLDERHFFTLLTQVMHGETVLSPAVAERVLSAFVNREDEAVAAEAVSPTLTTRQHEVLELVAQGLTNKEIAGQLHITEVTVKYHVSKILERLQLRSRHELARYAQTQTLY